MRQKYMLRGLVGLIIVCFSFSGYATDINVTIDWQEPILVNDTLDTKKVLYFQDASYPDQNTGLPWKSVDVDLGEQILSFAVTITSETLEPLQVPSDVEVPDRFDDSRLQWRTNTVFDVQRLFINYLPLVKKDGKWFKVTSAVLTYEVDNSVGKLKSLSTAGVFAENSVLSSGKWHKMKIPQSGLYKLTYEDIASLGLTPENVHVYGFGGAELDESYYKRTGDDLPEVPLWVNDGGDGVFSSGDYVIFYAQGPVNWNYNSSGYYTHEQNRFSSNSYYFISSNDVAINHINLQDSITNEAQAVLSSFDDYDYFEDEKVNLIRSGQEWYGEVMSPGSSSSFESTFSNRVVDEPVTFIFRGINQSYTMAGRYNLLSNGTNIGSATVSQTRISEVGDAAKSTKRNFSMVLPEVGDKISVDVDYSINEASAKGWIDYLTINAKRQLILESNQMSFRSKESKGIVADFVIQSSFSDVVVLDVTNQNNVSQMPLIRDNGKFIFTDQSTNLVKEYVAFNPKGTIMKPEIVGEVSNQDLHGSGPYDLVIVVKERLIEQAERLAELHRTIDSLSVLVVTPELIYNEFSSGRPDVTAIRYFAKLLRDKFDDNKLRYLLLFGDGSYDNREENLKKHSTYLLTYESAESLNKSNTFVSDDYFGLLDNGEGPSSSDIVDIGVGRLPVTTVAQAKGMVDKLESYMTMSAEEDWLNKVCFIGDDQDGNVHMRDANKLSKVIEDNHPEFIVRRVFLDAYQQEIGTSGESYPGAMAEIEELLHRGVLLISYSGHGGYNGLAHERIITSSMIESWENFDRLPLFVTATCDFSPYDHEKVTSAGELVLLNPNGGGIASVTTTRLVYASQNFKLGEKFYSYLFEKKDGKPYRLGDVFCLAKQTAGTKVNGRKFALLGDPALMLKYPQNKNIEITSVTSESSASEDTIRALEYITVKGQITNGAGQIDTASSGVVYPNLFDKIVNRHTLSNDGDEIFNFTSYDNMLFQGKAMVEKGEFQYSFYMPKDINYTYGKGRLYHYFDGNKFTSHKVDSNFVIGGLSDAFVEDTESPQVNAYINSPSFVSGDEVNQQSYFMANLSDLLGINTAGIGIGHDLTLMIDDDPYQLYNLNSYYEAKLGSSSEGEIAFQLPILEEGKHELSFKAWDLYNNSTKVEFDFVVKDEISPGILKCKVFPNPYFSDNEMITFEFEHDRPNDVVTYALEMFDINGKIVYQDTGKSSSSNGIMKITYNPGSTLAFNMLHGVYIYRISVEARGVESGTVAGRLLVMP